jgi:outer membrane protein TolC
MQIRSLRACDARTLILLALGACAAPSTASVSDADVVRNVDSRAASLDDVEHALELADVGPLRIEAPRAPSELDADAPDFWHACAFAWNPSVRRARRDVLIARAELGSAGKPGPIEFGVDAMDIGGSNRESDLMLTFDLLGLLHLGPARAARELAHEEERAAFAELERAVWTAKFEVDRAVARVSAAKARIAVLQALLDEAADDIERVRILGSRGWISRATRDTALASVHRVEHHIVQARDELANAQAELARVSGLDVAHPALGRITAAEIERVRTDDFERREPDSLQLLANLPELRARRLAVAVAEARVRRAAAERWPDIRIGPQVSLFPGDVGLGGILGVDIPFPGALDGRIEAAVQARNAALDALEDALVAARARIASTRVTLENGFLQRDEHALAMDESAARALAAAQARFRVEPEGVERWWMTLRERTDTLSDLVTARENAALAALDYDEARGPSAPTVAEVQP